MIGNTREYKAAMALSDALNEIGWSPKRFAESTVTLHRTIQQNLMRTIVEIIKTFGSEEYKADSRNQATKDLCKKIISTGVLNNSYLPFI